MRFRYTLYSLLFSLAVLLGSCSTPAAPELPPLTVSAAVRYLEDQSSLRGTLIAGTNDSMGGMGGIQFPSAGKLSFVGSGMQATLLPGPGTRYRTELRSPYPTDLRFTFPRTTTAPGPDAPDPFTLELRMSPPNVRGLPTTLSLEKGITVAVQDAPLAAGESILLFFSPTDGPDRQPRKVLIPGPTNGNRFRVPTPALGALLPGRYDLYLVKEQRVKRDTLNLRLATLVEFYSRTISVEVTD